MSSLRGTNACSKRFLLGPDSVVWWLNTCLAYARHCFHPYYWWEKIILLHPIWSNGAPKGSSVLEQLVSIHEVLGPFPSRGKKIEHKKNGKQKAWPNGVLVSFNWHLTRLRLTWKERKLQLREYPVKLACGHVWGEFSSSLMLEAPAHCGQHHLLGR